MSSTERRAALIEVSGEMLVEFLRNFEGGITLQDGTVIESVGDKIPTDAEVRGMSIGYDLTTVVLRIESPELRLVTPGCCIEKLNLKLRQTAPPVATKMEGVVVPETQVAAGLGFANVAEMRRWQTDEGQRSSELEQKLRTTAGDAQHFRYGLVRAMEVLKRIKDGSLSDPTLTALAIDVVSGGGCDWDKQLPWLNEIPRSRWAYPSVPKDDAGETSVASRVDIIGGFPEVDANCAGCGKPLTIENATLTDGCPCNSALGINSMNETRWRLLLELCQQQSRRIEELDKENASLATAAYDAAPAIPLSPERIDEIVKYATSGAKQNPSPTVSFRVGGKYRNRIGEVRGPLTHRSCEAYVFADQYGRTYSVDGEWQRGLASDSDLIPGEVTE